MRLEQPLEIVDACLEFSGGRTPDVAPAGKARLYYNAGADAFSLSRSGAAYEALSAAVDPAMIGDGTVTTAKLATNPKTHVQLVQVEDLAAGDDIAARAEFVAPAGGCTLLKVGIIPRGSSAGIDNSNTAVVTIADAAANVIIAKTYNTATQPPAANVYASLGTLDATHKVLTANEVVTVTVTQGATADLPGLLLLIEWQPAA